MDGEREFVCMCGRLCFIIALFVVVFVVCVLCFVDLGPYHPSACVHVCLPACLHVYVYVCALFPCMCLYGFMHMCVRACLPTNVGVWVLMCVFVCMCVCACLTPKVENCWSSK